MGSHTTAIAEQVRQNFYNYLIATTNGDHAIVLPDCYISKIRCNGNTLYSATPTSVIEIYYLEGGREQLIYGPLNIKTVDVSIGVTLHMETLLGGDLKAKVGGSIVTRIRSCNTRVMTEVWGYKFLKHKAYT